jgi:DNA-binding MarR family transcriptional regulator
MEKRFERFTVLMTGISRSIHKLKAEEMAEYNLKRSHVSCLYYLYKEDSLTAKELCDLSDEDKANISRAIKYLEERGYLVCRSKAQKRYQSPLELTEEGKAIGKRLVEKIDSVLEMAGEGVSDEDRMIMYRSLEHISFNLQQMCEKYKL